jgi:hypothetical protein
VHYNPVNFNDPTGHYSTRGIYDSGESATPMEQILKSYGITVSGGNTTQAAVVLSAAIQVGSKLDMAMGWVASSASAFRSVFTKGVKFVFDPRCDGYRRGTKDDGTKCGGDFESHGCTAAGGFTSGYTITFASMSGQSSNNIDRMIKNAIHEIGHSYYYRIGGPSITGLSRNALIANSPDSNYDWQQHPPSMNEGRQEIPGELFADTFIAWTLGGWNTSLDQATRVDVSNAQNAMDG